MLQHVGDDENVTALHKEVLLNLIHSLHPKFPHHGEDSTDSESDDDDQPEEIHEAGGEEVRPHKDVNGNTATAAAEEEDSVEQEQSVDKEQQVEKEQSVKQDSDLSGKSGSAKPDADSKKTAEDDAIERRKKFMQSICSGSESAEEDTDVKDDPATKESELGSPTETQMLEHRRGASRSRSRSHNGARNGARSDASSSVGLPSDKWEEECQKAWDRWGAPRIIPPDNVW